MADPALMDALRECVGGSLDAEVGPRPSDLTLRLARTGDLPAAAAVLVGAHSMALATVVATDETATPEGDLKVRYVFEPAAAGAPDRFVTLLISVDAAHPEVPSLTTAIAAANWHEREMRDLFGIVPVGHPDPRSLVVHDGWPQGVFPLRKAFDGSRRVPVEDAPEFPHLAAEGEGVFEIPVGPIHAGIIEPGHFRFSSVGETVLHLDARLFYTHRGLEKRMEGLSPLDAFYIAERICGVCSVAHGLGYCEAIEQIAGVNAPSRARLIRSIALELERLYNHVGDLGNICAGASFHYGTATGARLKERLQQMNERIAGNRFLRGLVIPGGVRLDLPQELLGVLAAALKDTLAGIDGLMGRIEANPSVVDRLDDTGVLRHQAAVDLAVTGVAARASGVDRDARREHPHGAFALPGPPELHVATGSEGDVMARVKVRALEARESIRLIGEFIRRLEPGPLRVALAGPLPGARIGISAIESARGEAVHWLRTDALGRVERYHLRSPSYHNWPAVALAAETAIVPDFPLVNKSFELCYSCTDR
ncbi:MAG: NADH-quinone oxidoreductase subunit C [Betaproteobacteria bacterium]|nr:NADH-quinone oxidoreductase subunit C [Betaproteobacteria bacterium]